MLFQHAQRQQVEKKRIHDEFNIATGLFRSRAVFAIGAIGGGRSTPDADRESATKDAGRIDDDHALTAIPQNQGVIGASNDKNLLADKPMQKRILRKVNFLRIHPTKDVK